MFEIALTVESCLRAGTRTDIAWVVDYEGRAIEGRYGAVAVTKGGAKMGSVLSNSLDSQLIDFARRHENIGHLARFAISSVDALINGVPEGGNALCVVVPATELPPSIWPTLIAREPICLICHTQGDSATEFALYTESTITNAPEPARTLFAKGNSATQIGDEMIISIWWPTTHLVIAGLGPIAEALEAAARLIGWNVSIAGNSDVSVAMIAGLSPKDATVIINHDVEDAGRALLAGLNSRVGYIGAVGSVQMQAKRADWLAYRGHTEISRIHGPAGLTIGAKTPAEIAVAIVAQIISII